ncbi:photosynthetic complex putative assembly protein PuhB [Jannaschia aquimarina]|uniref:YdbS-like PH domain-containing protein n=1 Tax=Jannaschia aquimarina TaxID=935700 RepID=A0A0D1CJK9_9RHOB|nr:photosynthetic complex putative assembly protein PuhB [Jannaschia aquimarina]KIT14882.1 hypothetical protein jaqu_32070 [Jannaschia aquimarina]SNS58301.1 PH domain-containing protein [Jannaschia aquimarina]
MDHDDFDQEPIRGLPQALPAGERILWQGAPSVWALARDALKVRWVAAYFVLFFLGSGTARLTEMGVLAAFGGAAFYLVLGAAACALLWVIAWCQAKATVYTITDARVVLRVGAALTMSLQFPYRWIGAADLTLAGDGTGTIALRTLGKTRFSYLLLWPHARPWRFNPPQPALRCIPDAASVARMLAEAAQVQASLPQVEIAQTQPTGATPVPAE